MECVERTQAVAKAMAEKKFELAVELRGRSFARNLETYKMLTRLKPPKESFNAEGKPIVSKTSFAPRLACVCVRNRCTKFSHFFFYVNNCAQYSHIISNIN